MRRRPARQAARYRGAAAEATDEDEEEEEQGEEERAAGGGAARGRARGWAPPADEGPRVGPGSVGGSPGGHEPGSVASGAGYHRSPFFRSGCAARPLRA